MPADDLQARFAAELRRQIGMDGTSTTSASATPALSVTLAPPAGPLEVLDIGRQNGAYSFKMTVKRDGAGLITDVQATPTEFVPLEAFK